MDFNEEIKKEAKKQYFKYFRFWMIGAAAVLLLTIGTNLQKMMVRNAARGNNQAPAERVYDFADVLNDEEEKLLREYIAKLEKKCHADLILVTIDQPVGSDDPTWENTMMNTADDFYDNAAYGWDKPYGDGALLLDNWYEDAEGSQKGSWLSTSGKMERKIGSYEEGRVFDRMDVYIDSSPYKAYRAALEQLAQYGDISGGISERLPSALGAVLISAVIALIYALVHLKQSKAKDTTNAATYVVGGQPTMRVKEDNFLRKSVSSHRIDTDSGSRSGGSYHSGGGSYGSHHSSGGHSHGGGGRRR